MKALTTLLLTLSILTATAQIRVAPNGIPTADGQTWANATTLENAITLAQAGNVAIWLHHGTYFTAATIEVPANVRLYGGFSGTETTVDERNFATHRTIIDANNQFAVMTLGVLASINGVTIQNGVANIPGRMNGGGVLMNQHSRIENSYIINNTAAASGGGIYILPTATGVRIVNTVIADNQATVDGFAVYASDAAGAVEFLNNTVVNNTQLGCEIYENETFHDTICSGNTIYLSAWTGGTHLWSTGATTPTIITAVLETSTTFTVTTTTPTFCVVTDTFQITVNPTPTVTVVATPTTANPGDMVTFTATPSHTGGTFLWNDIASTTTQSLTVQMPPTGDLQFTVNYTLNGCSAEAVTTTATNTECTPPVITGATLVADDLSQCEGGTTTLRLHLNDLGANRNSGEWVLFSGACGTGTELARTIDNEPYFTVDINANTTFFLRGEGCGVNTPCIQVTVAALTQPFATTAPSATLCVGENLTLTNTTAGGGTWSINGENPLLTGGVDFASEAANAAVITGWMAGNIEVIFTTPDGCQTVLPLEVLTAPSAIEGGTNFCQGQYRQFTALPTGGTWSIASGTSATVGATGIVTASTSATGTTTIQYAHPTTGCVVQQVVYVHAQPAQPIAFRQVCVGDTIELQPGNPAGGTWSIEPLNPLVTEPIATLYAGNTQIIGNQVGVAVLKYQLNAHCFDTIHITVLTPVTGMSYTNALCEDDTITAVQAFPAGGVWTSTNTAVATVNPVTGAYTGVSPGTFNLVYTAPNGCVGRSGTITVHINPEPITGEAVVGVGLTTQLSSATLDGEWSSLHPAVASVNATGLVLGLSAGTATIRYLCLIENCHTDFNITVDHCATISLANPALADQSVCLNSPILDIQYTILHATASQIAWTDPDGNSIAQPAGLSFNTTTHTISGSPSVSGVFYYTISTTNHFSACAPATASGMLTVFPAVLAGAIGSSQIICYGEIPVEFTSTTGGSGGNPVGATYQWQISTNNVIFENLYGSTSAIHQATVLTETRHFRRMFNNTCGNIASNTITVTVIPLPPTPTAESITPNTDCVGDSPNGIIVIANVAGMTFSIDSITFGSERTFGNLMHGEHRIFMRNASNCVSSAIVTVDADNGAPELTGFMSVNTGATICQPFVGGNIVISPTFTNLGASPTFQWAIAGATDTVPIAGATAQNLTLTTAPTETTTYRITVTNTINGCGATFYQIITVVTAPVVTTQPVGDTVCAGEVATPLTVVASCDATHTYQWQRSADRATFTTIEGATATSYSPITATASTYWYRVQILRTGGICPAVYSDTVQVVVLANPYVVSRTDGYRCGEGTVDISVTINPSTAIVYWYTNWVQQPGTSTSGGSWTTPTLATAGNHPFWPRARIPRSGGLFCYSPTPGTNPAVVAVVYAPHTIERTGGAADQTLCQGELMTTINFTIGGGATGGTIVWSGASTEAPEGLTATATSISGTVAATAAAGTYYFTITTTPSGGVCDPVTYSGSITVNTTPTGITITSEQHCGYTVLNASGGAGGTIYWQGTTSGGTSQDTPSDSVEVTVAGNHFFRVKSAAGCWGPQAAYTVVVQQPHTLTRTSAVATANQTVGQGTAITAITHTHSRPGSTPAVTITWTNAAGDTIAQPAWANVSSLTASPINITGTPTAQGTFRFMIATVANACESVSVTGTITVTRPPLPMTGCNNNTPGWGANLGTISWGTIGNTNPQTGSTTVTRAGTPPANTGTGTNTQVWTGNVTASACNKNTFNGGTTGNFNADCHGRATRNVIGDFFSWCAVVRFADQLCPYPWRVPTADDFRRLHWILTGQVPPSGFNSAGNHAAAYVGTAGTTASPQIGGTWRGSRFTTRIGGLMGADFTHYWSSTEINATQAVLLQVGASVVRPGGYHNMSFKGTNNHPIRCVRNP